MTESPLVALSPEACALAFLVAVLSGFVPFINVEAYLISVSVLSPGLSPIGIVVAAAAGQMGAKYLIFRGGRGLSHRDLGRHEGRIRASIAHLSAGDWKASVLLFLSALTGLPPFYVLSVAAGFVRFPGATFLAVGLGGRLVRFAALFLLPRMIPGVSPL